MKSKTKGTVTRSTIKVNTSKIGEPIEIMVARMVEDKEAVQNPRKVVYQERKEGVNPAYNIRTDKWEHAINATEAITASNIAKRMDSLESKEDISDLETGKIDQV